VTLPILLEHDVEGPFKRPCYNVKMPNGKTRRVSGKQAILVSLLLAGYEVKDDFDPLTAFDPEGVSANVASPVAADAGQAKVRREG
jgi:hypothetical protein